MQTTVGWGHLLCTRTTKQACAGSCFCKLRFRPMRHMVFARTHFLVPEFQRKKHRRLRQKHYHPRQRNEEAKGRGYHIWKTETSTTLLNTWNQHKDNRSYRILGSFERLLCPPLASHVSLPSTARARSLPTRLQCKSGVLSVVPANICR